MTFSQVEANILQWATDRKIIPNSSGATQLLKTVSELGELADATIKRDMPGVIDGVGDVVVTLILYCALMEINFTACVESAYNEIKDRRGTLLPNGVFVKEVP